MMLCNGVGCGTENLQLRLPLSFRFTHSENFSNFPLSLLHPLTQFPLFIATTTLFFLPSLLLPPNLCRFPLFSSLFSDTEPTEREENVSRQAKFCAALAASSLHKFPQHFPTMAFLSSPQSVPHLNSTLACIPHQP